MTAIPTPGTHDRAGISKPPSTFDILFDRGTRWLALGLAVATILLLFFILYKIGYASLPAVRKYGLGLVVDKTYSPSGNPPQFGLRPQILGTLYSSALALVIATVFGLAIAIFLSQNFLPRKVEIVLKNIVELLAAIPSVVYGLWGLFVVVPLIQGPANLVSDKVGEWFPPLSGHLGSVGMLPAAMVLAIMVLPTISAISYDALTSVNPRLKEAAFGLGATRWETILKVIVPTASTGIFGSIILGFGRALGETMALLMLLGSSNYFNVSLLAPGNTLAALIANGYKEAGPTEMEVLLLAGMLLLAITLCVNIAGAVVIQFANRNRKGARQ